jgi:hypothetical protein
MTAILPVISGQAEIQKQETKAETACISAPPLSRGAGIGK